MQTLRRQGYHTAAYLPSDWSHKKGAASMSLYNLGLSKCVSPDPKSVPFAVRASQKMHWKQREMLDTMTLELLKDDLSGWIEQDARFAVMYLPQIGHGPWVDIQFDSRERDMLARGRALMALQDKWLGDIVNALRMSGRLHRTIILVTSDHGVRTTREDPSFRGGMLDEYSFHVPLLLYVPEVLSQKKVIRCVTSHIDIAPSILDLLGLERGRTFEQGVPLWDKRLEGRVTFFFAGSFLGADGFYASGKYYMFQNMGGTVSVSNRMSFGYSDVVPRGTTVHSDVNRMLQSFGALRSRWAELAVSEQE